MWKVLKCLPARPALVRFKTRINMQEVTQKFIEYCGVAIGVILTVGFAAVWGTIFVGLTVHLVRYAWSAF
jgi:hypothetical protein